MGNKNRLPSALNVKQLQKLFEHIERPKIAIAAFVTFFCGLRISEICKLKVEDVDLENRRIKIVDAKWRGRSEDGYGKDRFVPIPRRAISPMQKWLEIIDGGKWFLPSMTSPDNPMRTKSLYEQFREGLQRSGLLVPLYHFQEKKGPHNGKEKIKFKYYFHTLRHSYATYLHEKGVDIYTISNLLGHNQVTTTQIYAKISKTQQAKAVEEAFSGPLMEFRPNFQQTIAQPVQNNNLEMERMKLDLERTKLEIEKMKLLRQQILIQTD
ncbi:tyrosine-type recombinase/integrase [Candidatus Woesearchaeota archaeon]|nr:tyrosine-type recombinase/integrase [Candidatus Woesearchaeota archaeon]